MFLGVLGGIVGLSRGAGIGNEAGAGAGAVGFGVLWV